MLKPSLTTPEKEDSVNSSERNSKTLKELQRSITRVRRKFYWIQYYARQLSPPRPVLEGSIEKLFTTLETVRDSLGQGCLKGAIAHLHYEEAELYMQIAKWCDENGNLCEVSYSEWKTDEEAM